MASFGPKEKAVISSSMERRGLSRFWASAGIEKKTGRKTLTKRRPRPLTENRPSKPMTPRRNRSGCTSGLWQKALDVSGWLDSQNKREKIMVWDGGRCSQSSKVFGRE